MFFFCKSFEIAKAEMMKSGNDEMMKSGNDEKRNKTTENDTNSKFFWKSACYL